MAKNDQEEALERLLTSTLTRTIDFVKFAEAKNAALLAFSSGWIVTITNFMHSWQCISRLTMTALQSAAILFTLSATLALWSFLPRRNILRFHRDPQQAKSLIYFGDIASFDVSSFKERARARYEPAADHSTTKEYIEDLSIQIAVNSKIANGKFTTFHIAGFVAFCGLIAAIIPPLAPLTGTIYSFLFGLVKS